MSEAESKTDGWLASLRRGGDSLLGLVQTRLELLAVELQEEKLRAIKLLVWFGVALTLLAAGLLVVIATLALWMWSIAGYLGLLGLAVLVLSGAGGILVWLRRQISAGPRPFTTTLSEFQKDREWLRTKV